VNLDCTSDKFTASEYLSIKTLRGVADWSEFHGFITSALDVADELHALIFDTDSTRHPVVTTDCLNIVT
jgi:hypothetical protein